MGQAFSVPLAPLTTTPIFQHLELQSFSIKEFMLVGLKALSKGRKGFAIRLHIFICLMFNLY